MIPPVPPKVSHIYLDSDGVFADLFGAFVDLGVDPNSLNRWTVAASVPHFYRSLKPLPDTSRLFSAVKGYGVPFSVLTASSRRVCSPAEAVSDKRWWWGRHFGDVPVIGTTMAGKASYAKPSTLLVDDTATNCSRFRAAGGMAILHTSVESTLRELQALLLG